MPASTELRIRWLAITATLTAVLLAFGYLTDAPPYQINSENQTELKLVVRHSGRVLGECKTLNTQELGELAPNMRAPMSCPREKATIAVKLKIDDVAVVDEMLSPSGLHKDGVLILYRQLPLVVGTRNFDLKITHQLDTHDASDQLSRMVDVDTNSIVIIDYSDSGIKLYQPETDS